MSLKIINKPDLMPFVAKRNGAQVIIVNNSATPIDKQAAVVLREDVAIALPKIVRQVKM